MDIQWQVILGTIAVWNVAAFALGTFPRPENQYARWLMGVLQFIVANKQKMLEAFNPEAPAPKEPQ